MQSHRLERPVHRDPAAPAAVVESLVRAPADLFIKADKQSTVPDSKWRVLEVQRRPYLYIFRQPLLTGLYGRVYVARRPGDYRVLLVKKLRIGRDKHDRVDGRPTASPQVYGVSRAAARAEVDAMVGLGSALGPKRVLINHQRLHGTSHYLLLAPYRAELPALTDVVAAWTGSPRTLDTARAALSLFILHESAPVLARGQADGLAHGELRPDTFVLQGKRLVLGDWSGAAWGSSQRHEPRAAAWPYAAFERLAEESLGRPASLAPCDVWSLAACVWAILSGAAYPFAHLGDDGEDLNPALDAHAAYAGWYPQRQAGRTAWPAAQAGFQRAFAHLPGGAVGQLLGEMLHPDPRARPTMADIARRLGQPSLRIADGHRAVVDRTLAHPTLRALPRRIDQHFDLLLPTAEPRKIASRPPPPPPQLRRAASW